MKGTNAMTTRTDRHPGVMLFDGDDARAFIREKVDSKAWWILPSLGKHADWLISEIEKRFYTGAANADFELLMGIPTSGVFSVFFAHKRRLSPKALARFMVTSGAAIDEAAYREALTTQDVLCIAGPEDTDAPYRMLAWHEWVMGRVA